jgi:pimeloyl-ACP methyl ester carboxylesterase
MFAAQQPLAVSTFEEAMGEVAWRSFPSWYLVAQSDEAIPPDAERLFAKRMGATVIEVNSNHLPMVSHPAEVVELIESAAEKIQQPNAVGAVSR